MRKGPERSRSILEWEREGTQDRCVPSSADGTGRTIHLPAAANLLRAERRELSIAMSPRVPRVPFR